MAARPRPDHRLPLDPAVIRRALSWLLDRFDAVLCSFPNATDE